MPNQMTVAVYYNNNDIRIETRPIPTINDNEMLIHVKASGICGSDVMQWYRIKKAPLILGHEIAGDITQIGKNVTGYKIGDRVFVSHHVPCNTCEFCLQGQHTICHTLHSTNFDPGGFAEYLRVPAINVDRGVFKLPDSMTYDEGVFIEPFACVIRGMHNAGFKAGQRVLILGSGISGLLFIKLAKAWGAQQVLATDITDFRLQSAKKAGATTTINAKDDVPAAVKKATDDRLVDLAVICTGAPPAVQQALKSVRPGGTVLLFAPTEPGVQIPCDLFEVWNKQLRIVSTYAGSPRDISEAVALLAGTQIKIEDLITHRLPLSEAGVFHSSRRHRIPSRSSSSRNMHLAVGEDTQVGPTVREKVHSVDVEGRIDVTQRHGCPDAENTD
jgi:L-iditol 2-dehydrogenase